MNRCGSAFQKTHTAIRNDAGQGRRAAGIAGAQAVGATEGETRAWLDGVGAETKAFLKTAGTDLHGLVPNYFIRATQP